MQAEQQPRQDKGQRYADKPERLLRVSFHDIPLSSNRGKAAGFRLTLYIMFDSIRVIYKEIQGACGEKRGIFK
jgi:hypothetical protein